MATSTVPFPVNTSALPLHFLYEDEMGKLKVSTNLPSNAEVHAVGKYNASGMDLGWDYLEVEPLQGSGRPYYSAGFLEGVLTADQIELYANFDISQYKPAVISWMQEQYTWTRSKVAAEAGESRFWASVGNIMAQMEGLADGYNHAKHTNITSFQMYVVNLGPEVGDIDIAVRVASGELSKEAMLPLSEMRGKGHCSGFIRATHDNLYMGHNTWTSYVLLAYRIYKVYKFDPFTITQSSHPATISSGDDWYQSSSGLGVQETTNFVFNTSLYTSVVPHTVAEFIRVMAATFTATKGQEWVEFFEMYNSGTYNNQYMVVDFKKYAPGSTIVPGTLWIAEQTPGYIHSGDVSDQLNEHGYWASYNIAYWWDIYTISGYENMKQQQGNFWSHGKSARPEIFRRNETMVTDLASMMRMMRYNNFQNDDLSIIPNCSEATNNQCDPSHSSMLTISARGDLLTVYNTTAENKAHYGVLYDMVSQGCFGAIDAKIAAWSNRYNLKSYVVSGPTNDQQPTFTWGDGCCRGQTAPRNSPQTYDFPWVEFEFN